MKEELTLLVQGFYESFEQMIVEKKKIHKKERLQLLEKKKDACWVYKRPPQPSTSFSAPWDDGVSLYSVDEEDMAESSL